MTAKGGIPVKKLFCVMFLMIVSFVFVVPVFAESEPSTIEKIHDMLPTLTDEDLDRLETFVEFEIKKRNLSELKSVTQDHVTVQPGQYRIGADIPAGVYTITPNGYTSMLTIYDADGMLVTMYSVGNGTSVGRLELADGQRVDIVGDSVTFKPYAGGLGF